MAVNGSKGFFSGTTNNKIGDSGGDGGDAVLDISVNDGSLTAQSITLTAAAGDATAGFGGLDGGLYSKDCKDNRSGDGGKAGIATISGLVLSGQQAAVKVANDIVITATGGKGGYGGGGRWAARGGRR